MTIEEVMKLLSEWATLYGLKVFATIFILIVGKLAINLSNRLFNRLMSKSRVDETLTKFLSTLVKVFLTVFVIIMALGTLGIQTASMVAILGAAGLAIGLALQGSLSNFASGVMLILFRPIKAGELVDVAGHLGTIKEIHIFNTIMVTLDNKRVIIPNSQVTGTSIVNYSAEGTLRVDMVFGISYADNISKAKQILLDIIESDPRVLKDPAPMVAVKELGSSSVDFVVRPYVTVADYWSVYFDTTEKVKMTFDEKGVSIPFPQRDIHLHQTLPV